MLVIGLFFFYIIVNLINEESYIRRHSEKMTIQRR
jgi:hypothetical protein